MKELNIKADSIVYGLGPLMWGVIAFKEIHNYPSCLALTVQLSLISCLYSIMALSTQMITQNSKTDNTPIVVDRLFQWQDMRRDPRYLVLALTTFAKVWFSLRLLKTADCMSSFFFLCYADTFVQQIFDQVMTHKTAVHTHAAIPTDDLEQVPLEPEPVKTGVPSVSASMFVGVMIWVIGLFMHLIVVGNPMIQLKLVMYLLVCAIEVYVLKFMVASYD